MFDPLTAIPRAVGRATTLLASTTPAAGAVSTNGNAVRIPEWMHGVAFTLDLTAAATEVGDTLDVTVQTLIDGTNWLDICHFTQLLGNGGAKRYTGKCYGAAAEAMFEHGSALAAGSVRHLLGDAYRVKYVQVDANSNAAFTFSVSAMPL